MKNIFLLLIAFSGLLLVSSCNDEIPRTLQGEYVGLDNSNTNLIFLRTGSNEPVDFAGRVNLIAVPQSSAINFTYEVVDSLTTAIENVHYTIASNSGSIASGETSGLIPIQILPDNIEQDERLELTIVMTGADVDLANRNPVTFNISVTCESDLAGTVDYVHTDNWTGTDLTGSVEMTVLNNLPGVYKFSDFSFGTFAQAGIADPTGNHEFTHLCGVVNITGTDQFGETWALEEVIESGGPKFIFRWSDTYGDFGTVELTRQDGRDWPPMTK